MTLVAAWDLGPATREALGAAAQAGGDPTLARLGGLFGDAAVAALAELVRERGERVVLLPRDDRTAEIAPRLAERLGGTCVTQAVGVEDGVWTRSAYGGKALVSVRPLAEPVVATLVRGAFPAADPDGVPVVEAAPPAGEDAVELLGVETPAADGASLEDAKVIVAGGAGLGAGDAFRELEELAGLLGGAVGASLAAVDAGWAPPERQVGLTGKVVSPDVYFALGISGASQHLAGIGGAKAVVAVNTDAEAPIFASAKLGVVMDCHTFVSSMIEQLRSSQ
jgi:electron transfer flavoprotein alpha subunit